MQQLAEQTCEDEVAMVSECSSDLAEGVEDDMGVQCHESFDDDEPKWLLPPFGKQHQLAG